MVSQTSDARAVMEAATLATRRDGDTLVVELAGPWHLRAGLPATTPVEEALTATPAPGAVAFDATGLSAWDSSFMAYIDPDARMCAGRQCAREPGAVPGGVRRELLKRERQIKDEGVINDVKAVDSAF